MSNMTILLVEDNADDELLALRALKKTDVPNDVVVTRDGQEALDYIFGQGKFQGRDIRLLPKVVFLDLKLPKLDGLEVLRKIRQDERTKRLPVVLLTSSDEVQDMKAGYDIGVNSYINKPVDFDEFVSQVKLLGQYWLGVNRVPALY
ncbi:MAG: two-component system response regulator [Pseudomonadales bacterium]|jgi:two-component system, response regulator|uniref:response regulator n=1 Tax=unclassified Ketobacter TaxID=2639109 RepID=UPI000C97D307|nr:MULTISPECIES: response regulator [unclassified Ketobacter]MAA58991.1 two-component system response regulator [Pseudomonadales bacterium]MEC8813823.1 response regulator [Pseudomonadota bacterium]TNC88484.1 MAG: two-component system response regulator [Alcanivorax sp.]HAG96566.1 two-component system response regulator [Gammaproteobacteria bacterium]MAQ23975.1 two-component system response regulator [Pseudomonadales bacterium]|tara:strand:+ start:5458 stop:5898 length:441 start_codon:yes stop_codon:yes gene_type:complete